MTDLTLRSSEDLDREITQHHHAYVLEYLHEKGLHLTVAEYLRSLPASYPQGGVKK